MISFIEIQKFLELPCNVYLKDVKGIYRECNIIQAENFGAEVGEVIGKSDMQLHQIQEECQLCAIHDLEVLTTGSSKIFMEPIKFINKATLNMLSYKIPCHDKKGKIIGVFGMSIALENIHSSLFPFSYEEHVNSTQQNLGAVRVTKRERECLDFLEQGMTAKQIGRKLSLSPRTIEFYIENMKKKLSCANRIQLIAKVKTFDILK